MSQPNSDQSGRTLQVDVAKVIEIEADRYQQIVAGLVRQNSVLQAGMADQDEYITELEAKCRALGGMSTAPGIRQPNPVLAR